MGVFGPAKAKEARLIDAVGYELDELPPPKGLQQVHADVAKKGANKKGEGDTVAATPADMVAAAQAADGEEAEATAAKAAPISYAGPAPPLAKMAVKRFCQKHRRLEQKQERKAAKKEGKCTEKPAQ